MYVEEDAFDPLGSRAEADFREESVAYVRSRLTAPKSLEKRAKRYHKMKEVYRKQRAKIVEAHGINYATKF